MRRSTLCLRSVHLPLRWLHPAEGSFLGRWGTDRVGVKNFRVGRPWGAVGRGRDSGFADFRFDLGNQRRGKPRITGEGFVLG